MRNQEILELREEYTALVLVADGLADILRASAACNLLTIARLIEDARAAARKIASLIEQLMRGPVRVGLGIWAAMKRVGETLLCALSALAG